MRGWALSICITARWFWTGYEKGGGMKKVNVLGVEIDQGPVKELKAKATGFLYNDVVNTIGIVDTKLLVEAGSREDLKEAVESMDLTVIGEKSILDAAGITDIRRVQEVENQVFVREFFRSMERRNMTVFLLTDTEAHLKEMHEFFRRQYEGLQIEGTFSMDRCLDDDNMAVNEINGSAADVVISALDSPFQEEFMNKEKKKLNVRLWFSVGYLPSRSKKNSWKSGFFRRLVGNSMFRKKVQQYHKKEEVEKH